MRDHPYIEVKYKVDGIPLTLVSSERCKWIPYIGDTPVPIDVSHYTTQWRAYWAALVHIANDTLRMDDESLIQLDNDDRAKYELWLAFSPVEVRAHMREAFDHHCGDGCAIPSHHTDEDKRAFYASKVRRVR